MIVKIQESFTDTNLQPVMLILTQQEREIIKNMKDDQIMIAFYPKNQGYSEALINQWMNTGVNFVQEKPNDGQNNVQG